MQDELAIRHIAPLLTEFAVAVTKKCVCRTVSCYEALGVDANQHISAPLLNVFDPGDRAIASICKNKLLRMHSQSVQRFSGTFAKCCRYREIVASQNRQLQTI